jgi:PAS domain S-box-containing protein
MAEINRVLLIDKSEADYHLINSFFCQLAKTTPKKYQLEWLADTEKWQKKLASQEYHVYLIDFLVRLYLIEQVRRQSKATPIIILTNNYAAGIAAAEAGATDYLDKTNLTLPILERSLRLTLTNSSIQQQSQQFIQENQQHKETIKKLQYQLILENILTTITRKLASESEVVSQEILGKIGIALSVNYAFLIQFSPNRQSLMSFTYWSDINKLHQIKSLNFVQLKHFPWCQEKFKNHNIIMITDLNTLPAIAKVEAQLLRSLDICSLLAVPIYTPNGQLWGAIGLNNHGDNYRYWSIEEIQFLKIVSKIIYLHYQRIATQRKLQASEALYEGIFNHSADGIFLMDVGEDDQLVYETINPAYETIAGICDRDIVGKTIGEVLPPSIAKLIERQYRACISSGKPLVSEHPLEIRGETRNWRTILVPIADEQGKMIKLQGSARDITTEKQAIAHQIHLTRYRHLLRSVTIKIRQSFDIQEVLETTVTELQKTLNADRVVLFQLESNTSGKVIKEAVATGYRPMLNKVIIDKYCEAELINNYFEGYVSVCEDVETANLSPCYREFLEQYQIRANLVLPIFRHSSTKRNNSTTLESKDSTQYYLWGLLSMQQCSQPRQWTKDEIELLQQLVEQLNIALSQAELLDSEIKQRQELARSNAELEQFAYVASHDLQAPLHTISNYASLLERRYQEQLDAKAHKYINYIVDGARRMRTQIEDLLEYSRLGRSNSTWHTTDCNLIVHQAIANLQAEIEASQANIVFNGDLPTQIVDPSQLIVLWQNLIENALKYCHEVRPIIQIKVNSLENHWQFAVSDNGIGIEPQYRKRIFQIFQRLHTQDEYPGTGIGLAICQKIVERHGGSIWVKSQLGQGSTFYFTIPKQP